MSAEYPIGFLCETFEVSRSAFYAWRHAQIHPSTRTRENAELVREISRLHEESGATYGVPRIVQSLRRQGRKHGRNRIAHLMRRQGLCGRQKRKFRLTTTDSNHDQPIAPNRLAQKGPMTQPNEVWAGDITYVQTQEGWLYVAAILDLYSRRIVGWSMSERIDTALVMRAWNMALTQRLVTGPALFHSDRGVQYASAEYRQALAQTKTISSMSRKACCYDNATMESFWSTLKLELIYRREFSSREQARQEIFRYIETFYNTKRLHSALGYLAPAEFENQKN